MSLPLTIRELNRRGRRRWVFALRMLPAGLSLYAICLGCIALEYSGGDPGQVGEVGTVFRLVITLSQVAVAVLFVPLASAGLIATERNEGTLELLLVTGRRPTDIFFSKLAAVFVQVETLLLAILPLTAIAAYLGGVYVPAEMMRFLSLSVWALALSAVGLWCSSVTRNAQHALLLIIFIEAGWLAVQGLEAILLDVSLTGPLAWSRRLAVDLTTLDIPGWAASFFGPVLVTVVFSWLGIRGMSWADWPQREVKRNRRARLASTTHTSFTACASLIDAAASEGGIWSGRGFWLQIPAAVVLFGLGLGCPVAGLLIVMTVISFFVIIWFHTSLRSGLWEEILLIPLPDRTIGRGLFLALYVRSLVFCPAFVAGVAGPTFLFWRAAPERFQLGEAFLVLGLVLLVALVVQAFVVMWACAMATTRLSPVVQTLIAVFTESVFLGLSMMFILIPMGSLLSSFHGDLLPLLVLSGFAVVLPGLTVCFLMWAASNILTEALGQYRVTAR